MEKSRMNEDVFPMEKDEFTSSHVGLLEGN